MGTRTYRAAPATYAVFGTIALALAVLWVAAMRRSGASFGPLAIPLGGFALAALWLSRFRVTFDDVELVLCAPFQRTRRIARQDILSVELALEGEGTESPFVLCFRTSGGEELRLNAKVFSAVAVRHLLGLAAHSKSPA